MKETVKRMIRDETGKVLILTLVLLVIGGLVLAPLLGLMSTGLIAGQVYEKNTAELYAADAGIEKAIWHLKQGGSVSDVLEFTLNGKNVRVEIEQLNAGQCYEPALYEIRSTATNPEVTSSTRVKARVSGIVFYVDGDYTLHKGDTIEGHVWVEGTLELSSDAEIWGNVWTGGDLILNEHSLVAGIICVGGNLITNEDAQIYSEAIHVEGYLKMSGGVEGTHIHSEVYVRGNVDVDGQCQIFGETWSGGDVTVGANARINGDLHMLPGNKLEGGKDNARITGEVIYDYHDDWGCPLVRPDTEIKVWVIV